MKKVTWFFIFLIAGIAILYAQAGGTRETLEITGQVNAGNAAVPSGNRPIVSPEWRGIPMTGSVQNGRLSVRISTPAKLHSFNENHSWFFTPGFLSNPSGMYTQFGISGFPGVPGPYNVVELYNNLNFSVTGVEYNSFSSLYIDASGEREIVREIFYENDVPTYVHDEVFYVYLNKDVTITGVGKTTTLRNNSNNNIVMPITTANINIDLKRGWNTLLIRTIRSRTQTGDIVLRIEMYVNDPEWVNWLYYSSRGL